LFFKHKKISEKCFAMPVGMRLARKNVTGVTCYREEVGKWRIGLAVYVTGVSRFGARECRVA
jgi:hypothetical protein